MLYSLLQNILLLPYILCYQGYVSLNFAPACSSNVFENLVQLLVLCVMQPHLTSSTLLAVLPLYGSFQAMPIYSSQ